jgi:hypothetical protein
MLRALTRTGAAEKRSTKRDQKEDRYAVKGVGQGVKQGDQYALQGDSYAVQGNQYEVQNKRDY